MEIWSGNQATHDAISVPGIDAWISSEPCRGDARGGDIHYVSMCGCGHISRFAVADVSGHGDAVGRVGQRLRSLMRKHINTADQSAFAVALNGEFTALARHGQFATALLTTYFPPTDHLIVCNAGHPRPLWYRVRTGAWKLLRPELSERAQRVANLPLGVVDPTDFVQFAVKLEKGDLVLLYTDALIESRNAEDEELGEEGLLDLVRGLDPAEPQHLSERILAGVRAYRGGAAIDDDETLLVLHHNAADPPRQSFGRQLRALARMFGLLGE